MEKWYNDDNFWKDTADLMFKWEKLAGTPQEVDNIIELSKIKAGTTILDLCCGIGRHSIELSKRGYKVTGVDKTLQYLKQAKEQAKKEKLKPDFLHSDMLTFINKESYELCLSLFTSFGYFEKHEDNLKVLSNIYASLTKTGKLIIELQGKEIIAKIFQQKEWQVIPEGYLLIERSIENDWSWINNRWILVKLNTRKEYKVCHWLYSAVELKEILLQTGFSSVDIYGGLDGSLYDQNAKRLVVVAKK